MQTQKLKRTLVAAAVALFSCAAAAQNALDLSTYRVTAEYALDALGGLGLEASAVTFARDRGTLFYVGDEGLGVVEISRTGQTLGSMRFANWPAASTDNDAEGLTYLGNGVLVVAEERLQDAFRFSYAAGGSVALADADYVSIGPTTGNVGTEGISFDARDGSFVSVKQANPQGLLAGSLSFAAAGGVSTMVPLFDADAVLGLNSLSDVQTLSPVDALAGTPAADNLLVLSLDSRRLVEIDRGGTIVSDFDLAGVTSQAIEGVTIDNDGVIYLVAEDSGTGHSRLFVMTPVPEPSSLALLLGGGLALWGWRAMR